MAQGRVVYRGPSVTISYEPDKAGMAACAVGPELREGCTAIVTSRALPYALNLASGFRRTGDYMNSFRVVHTTTTIRGMRRVSVWLANDSNHSLAVEFGNEHVREPHRVLQRTVEHLMSEFHP